MTTITRNEDVDLTKNETIPDGHYLHKGKFLMDTARAAKVPFGVCRKRTHYGRGQRMETIGLIIRNEDRATFTKAVAKQNAKKKKP